MTTTTLPAGHPQIETDVSPPYISEDGHAYATHHKAGDLGIDCWTHQIGTEHEHRSIVACLAANHRTVDIGARMVAGPGHQPFVSVSFATNRSDPATEVKVYLSLEQAARLHAELTRTLYGREHAT